MDVVVPTILTTSEDDLRRKLGRVKGLVETVQIDVVDGRFAGPSTWPYTKGSLTTLASETGWLTGFGDFRYEIDLMVEAPEESAGFWIAAGASRIVIHVEAARHLPKFVEELKSKYGYEKGFAPDLLSFGLALNIDTDTSAIAPFLDSVDYIQFMGINTIGRQGQPFDPRVLPKIRAFKKAYPGILIQVDGGASLRTAPELLSAGVNRLVVGSDLWEEEDIEAKLSRFARVVEEHGAYA